MQQWILYKVTSRLRDGNIGGFFSLTNKSNLLEVLYKIKGTILRGKKTHEWKEPSTRSDVIFECSSHVISHYPVKFGDYRTYGTGGITLFICHETSYNHVIKEPCGFVHGGIP